VYLCAFPAFLQDRRAALAAAIVGQRDGIALLGNSRKAGANHFFDGKVEPLLTSIGAYLDKRLKTERKPSAA
jgi:alpha/beta superfamily hydrolase